MGYMGTRNGWGTTGGRAGGHPAVVGMRNERGDCCWGPCQHFRLASVIWLVGNARARHLVWDLLEYGRTLSERHVSTYGNMGPYGCSLHISCVDYMYFPMRF